MSNETKKITMKSGHTLAYQELGNSARVLIGLSGLGCDHYNFEFMKESLAQHFRLILIDNRGMGESSDVRAAYEMKDLALDVVELADQLGIHDFGIIGISMGGFIAQELLGLSSERIKALALLCSTSGGADFVPLTKISDEAFEKAYAMGELGHELAVKATVDPTLASANAQLLEQILKLRLAHPYRLSQVLLQNQAAARFLASEVNLTHFLTPALIMHGEDDRFVSPQNAQVLAEKFQNSTLHFVAQTDHLFFLEKSDECAQVLIHFFNTHWESL